jgi:hypothetical protein
MKYLGLVLAGLFYIAVVLYCVAYPEKLNMLIFLFASSIFNYQTYISAKIDEK